MTEILSWLWPHLGDGCAYGVVLGLLGMRRSRWWWRWQQHRLNRSRRRRS